MKLVFVHYGIRQTRDAHLLALHSMKREARIWRSERGCSQLFDRNMSTTQRNERTPRWVDVVNVRRVNAAQDDARYATIYSLFRMVSEKYRALTHARNAVRRVMRVCLLEARRNARREFMHDGTHLLMSGLSET